jgi:hypothetical protein
MGWRCIWMCFLLSEFGRLACMSVKEWISASGACSASIGNILSLSSAFRYCMRSVGIASKRSRSRVHTEEAYEMHRMEQLFQLFNL